MSHPSAPSSSLQRSFHDRANSRYSPYTRPSPPVFHNTDYVPGGRIMRLSPGPQRRPASTIWLQSLNPGWTDGAVEPPQFYHSHAEMNETRAQYGYAPLIRSPSPLDRPVLQQVNHSEPPNSQGHTVNYDVRADENNRRRVEEGRLVEQPEFEVERAVTPDLAIQCNVHVAVVRTSVSTRTSRSKPPSSKTTTTTKADRISISPTMTRVSFIEACLQVHDPHPRYRPTSGGPRFLMQWTGVAKAKACCIDDDRNFSSALKMFLDKARDKKGKLDLSVEFDLNSLEAFRIPDSFNPAPNPGDDQGTEIPYVGQFTEDEQLHGGIILMLKQTWLCGKHLGEHREPGYCYVPKDATERHYGLNARKLRVWAAAIAAHECSKHEPPPEVLDGGCRDGEPSADVVRSRGRTGPRPGPVQPLLDPTTLLTAAIVPLLTSMAERTIKPSSSTIASAASAGTLDGPVVTNAIVFQKPLPAIAEELHACLVAFRDMKAVDVLKCEPELIACDYTPDILPEVPVAQLVALLDIPKGSVLKLRAFCRVWYTALEAERRRS